MSGARFLVAEFDDAAALLAAARHGRDAGWTAMDAHVPFALAGLGEALGLAPSRLRPLMLAGGCMGGAAAFALQWYSAVWAYPINSGGRPLASWQAFLVPAVEGAIIAAALAGFLGFLVACRLPCLHHAMFSAPGFARSSQDRFFLATADPRLDMPAFAAALAPLRPCAIREVR